MRIGIDVGGTNTDAVLMDRERVLASTKAHTTEDITTGIVSALHSLQQQSGYRAADIRAVMIGTTHFINALVEARGLAPTAAIRLGLPATAALPPMVDWPERVLEAIQGRSIMCHGGHEFDGRRISDLDEDELVRAAQQLGEDGVRSIAITSVFSPVSSEFEKRAAEILSAQLPGVAISLSHEIGRIGLLERENATIINASLCDLADHIIDGLAKTVVDQGILAPLYLSQNDGTLMDLDHARRYPVVTFASGPTNSMRGAAFLSGLERCAVVDVGGTTSDVGVLEHGFPREASAEVDVAGIRTNFRMPDVVSIGIGGGSVVRGEGDTFTIGPDSVGYRLHQDGLVFGGRALTATDVTVASGRADIGDAGLVAHLDRSLLRGVLDHIGREVGRAVEQMRTSAEPLPVVAVGGGSIILPDELAGCGPLHRPDGFSVANAIGAAIAQVGAEVDRVFTVEPGRRDGVLDEAKQEAVDRAVAAGARVDTVRIVEVDEVPIAYLPGNATRIRIKAVGELGLST